MKADLGYSRSRREEGAGTYAFLRVREVNMSLDATRPASCTAVSARIDAMFNLKS